MKKKGRFRAGLFLFLFGPVLSGLTLYKVYCSLNIGQTSHDSIIEPMLVAIVNQGLIPIIAIGALVFIVGGIFLYSCLSEQ